MIVSSTSSGRTSGSATANLSDTTLFKPRAIITVRWPNQAKSMIITILIIMFAENQQRKGSVIPKKDLGLNAAAKEPTKDVSVKD